MSKDKKTEPKKPLWKRLIKWTLILGALTLVLFTILARMGGSSDVLKTAIEDFLSDVTPYTVRVTKLNEMHFFPNIMIDVEGIEFREGEAGEGEAVIRVAKARVSQGFFDVVFSRQRIRELNMAGFSAMPGTVLPKPLSIETATIQDEEGEAALIAAGKIGDKVLNARIGVEAEGKAYALGRERAYEINLGKLSANGRLRNTVLGDWQLENAELAIDGKKAVRGNFTLSLNNGTTHVKGQGKIYPYESDIKPDVKIETGDVTAITGNIDSDVLILGDLDGAAPFLSAIDALGDAFGEGKKGPAKIDLSGLDVNVDLDIKQIRDQKLVYGSIKTPVTIKDSVLTLKPLSGTISKGALEGSLVLDAVKAPATLKVNTLIKDFDYAAFQKQFAENAQIDGKANILLDLSSSGNNADALMNNLKGKASFVGGQGSMRSGLLEIWGGGLLNALLPKLDKEEKLNMNCVVVNVDIEDMKARSDAVFVDTRRITLQGEGVYNYGKDYMDMVLEPKAKDIAIGDISSAINVTGPINDLSVKPNIFSLGKKVGGLLLGAVNPAFYALTLADLGLSDKHPCKQYVIEKESLPPPEEKAEEKKEPANDNAAPTEKSEEQPSVPSSSTGNE